MSDFLEKVVKLSEELDWSVDIDNDNIEFRQYSPMGQDFSFYVDNNEDELLHNIYSYMNGFDPSEESMLWVDSDGHGRNGAPYDLKDIIEDMESCKTMMNILYLELYSKLS